MNKFKVFFALSLGQRWLLAVQLVFHALIVKDQYKQNQKKKKKKQQQKQTKPQNTRYTWRQMYSKKEIMLMG
jgi:hypothetical protein